jgi:peptidoglycan/xylan/chitin deacetylase (PgdA/CDA1 family)
MKRPLPNGAKCAVTLSFEYDAESVEWGYWKSISGGFDIGGFSPSFGIPRILELLDKHDVKGTFFVPAWDAERHPDSVKEIVRAMHEVAAHGYVHEDFSQLAPGEEKEIFEKSHKILTEITGASPQGFRAAAYGRPISPKTLGFCQDMGYIYDSSFMDDDKPYPVTIEGKLVNMVEIPWSWPLNDISFMSPPFSSGMGLVLPQRKPQWILELWKEEFDSLYEELGFFNLVVHPRDMGRVSRLPILEGIISYIKRHDVWFATYSQIAEFYLR